MVLSGKMKSHSICLFAVSDIKKMRIKSLNQTVFGLAHILFVTSVARNKINEVRALARNVKFTWEIFTCSLAGVVSLFS